jgi:hypothetical protein
MENKMNKAKHFFRCSICIFVGISIFLLPLDIFLPLYIIDIIFNKYVLDGFLMIIGVIFFFTGVFAAIDVYKKKI